MRRILPALLTLLALVLLGAGAVNRTGWVPGPVGGLRIALPLRRPALFEPTLVHSNIDVVTADGATIRGWLFSPVGVPRALIVYLHGKDENRVFGVTVAERYVPRGYAVVAIDLRGHGVSGGVLTTYGAREVGDLAAVLDSIPIRPVILIGKSLGAAIALEAAPGNPRIAGVVAVASFADLGTRIKEAAGGLDTAPSFEWLARNAGFRVQAIAPRDSAGNIHVPVLLVHGTIDKVTSMHHSVEILDALEGAKRLLTVEGAGHDDVLYRPEVWDAVDLWLPQTEAAQPTSPP